MICSHPRCTGNHDDRKYDTLCPRSLENKRASKRKSYHAQTWFEHHKKQLATRRLRAVQRMRRRASASGN